MCEGVSEADLQGDDLEYRRARDKADKSLELYKFQVNALYVAMTRAVATLTLVEQDTGHPLLALLGLRPTSAHESPCDPGSQTGSSRRHPPQTRKQASFAPALLAASPSIRHRSC